MERRDFVTSAIAMAGAALSGGEGWAMAQPAREYYQLRKYTLQTGPQLALTQTYFEHALIPALNRMAITPVGAFKLDVGPETPTYYLLIPATSVEALVTLDRGWPRTRFPQSVHGVLGSAGFCTRFCACGKFADVRLCGLAETGCAEEGKRIFQLRTYESAGYGAHVRKVQMFNESEIGIFTRTGLTPVFFGDTLIGHRMPSLTYMLTFADVADLNAKWGVFGSDPAWKELSHQPQNSDAEIVCNISNLYLSPLSCSQI